MRSTGFVVLSILVHCLAVAAIAVTPTHTVSSAGDKIEVAMGEPAEKPGVPDAPPTVEESKPQAVSEPAPPQPKVEPKPEPVKPQPVKTVKTEKPAQKPAKTKAVVAAEPPKQEKSAPPAEAPVADEGAVAVAAATVPAAAEDAAEEKEILMPVKDTAPAGVEAASSEDDAAATEAKSSDLQKTADPTPVAVATTTAAGAVTGEELAKGGASKEGAVSYLDLKQMPGNKSPVYPLKARMEKRQGSLELLYRVTKEGKVSDIQVAKSSGFKDLDDEAVKAIAGFRFVPGQEGWARHPIAFNLKGAVTTMPSQLRSKGAQVD